MRKIIVPYGLMVLSFSFIIVGAGSLSAQLAVGAIQTNVTCNGFANGSATAIPTGGTGHYSYLWMPSGATTAAISGLAAGTYTVTLTDTVSSGAQVDTVYFQDFQGTHGWTLNVSTGANGADPNFWTVNDNEGGATPTSCQVSNNGNKTLHITSEFNPVGGAAYDAGGLCGILFCPQTSSRAESPSFSTVGHFNNTLEFDFIANGDGLLDNASVWYNSGSGWTLLTASLKSPLCGNSNGQWSHYNVALPPSCDNNASVKIGINWINNDDGVGSDPSVAINDVLVSEASGGQYLETAFTIVTITQPAVISASQTVSLCAGDSLIVGTNTYSSSGVYTNTLTAANGCDSILTTNLTIQPPIDVTISLTGVVITAATAGAGVTYQWVNCNTNSIILEATNQTYSPTASGSYAVIISQNGCSDTSDCMNLVKAGINENDLPKKFYIYPNPATNQLNIKVVDYKLLDTDYTIYDSIGKSVITGKFITENTAVDLKELPSGIYLFHFGEDIKQTFKLIKK